MRTKLTDDERASLTDGLARVVSVLGVDRVLTRPTVLPDERHFPDPWAPSALGVARLARRLMRFAGMPEAPVYVDADDLVRTNMATGWFARAWSSSGGCVQLVGTRAHDADTGGDALAFAVDLAHLVDPDIVVATCAREVARAALIVAGTAEVTEVDVDLAAIALGFGVLTANASHRIRAVGAIEGAMYVTTSRRDELGALGPRASAFALACLASARGLDAAHLKNQLETNQGAWFADDARALPADAAQRALGLPPSASAPASIRMDELLGPIASDGLFAADDAAPDTTIEPDADNSGRPVFGVQRTRAPQGFLLGAIGASVAIVALHLAFPPAALVVAACTIGGIGFGRAARRTVCSDATCETVIPAGARTCPGCGGLVAGHIASRDERLRAEEEWRASQRR